jgi:AcrR family transcriptional regulator
MPNSSTESHAEHGLRAVATPATLQTRKQELVRNAIWYAAIDLFAQKGFDETTVDEIAQAAGVSRRSFVRYFVSKSDLMAQGIINYGAFLTETIEAFPQTYSLSAILHEVVVHVAQHSAAQARTRKIMQIAAKYPAAREAQIARVADVQEQVAEAFARRCSKDFRDEVTAHILAGLTLSILSVAFRTWFENDQQNISVTVDRILQTLSGLLCEERKAGAKNRRKPVAVKRRVKQG